MDLGLTRPEDTRTLYSEPSSLATVIVSAPESVMYMLRDAQSTATPSGELRSGKPNRLNVYELILKHKLINLYTTVITQNQLLVPERSGCPSG